MILTQPQLLSIKAAILADPVLNAFPSDGDGLGSIANALNLTAVPDFWVWRTDATRSDVYHNVSVDGTSWSWATFKAQSVPEQNAWTQMFMNDRGHFQLPNFRAGVSAIFGGTAPQLAQNTHCLAIGRRLARRIEKILATGVGTALAPATMSAEGLINGNEVDTARRSV